MKNHTVLIILLLTLTKLSCKDKCSDVRDLLSIRDSQINLRFVDITSGRLLIRDSDGSYTPADVKVFNAAQEEIPFRLLSVNSSGGIKEYSISIPVLMEQGLNYLPREQYGYRVYINLGSTTNIIDYTFRIKKLDCTDQLEYLTVNYNNVEVDSVINTWESNIEIKQ
jgi:hypothetical protein